MAAPSEKSLFLSALEKGDSHERNAFLSEACGGDARLRAEVDELLRAHERDGNVLDDAPVGVGAVRAELEAGGIDRGRLNATADFQPVAERPGMVIGPYKLMEQIGEGGFALVFVAEQQQPVRRKVALKVIKPGMDTREVIARFEAERQALALMDHPNIARVFDAGATDAGRPFFVMELVRGIPITDFCDQHQLTPRERLELFVHVCQAVQHAHQKGIIHRDLKPSNVMVTLHDGTPVVKVIDFGILKAVGQNLTDKTIYTRFAQLIGTPLYMSPEQAQMSALDVDTRSDIYSLGVLLYELLSGTTPFDRARLQSATFDEIRRIIREEEPPRPSTRLTALGLALDTVAAQRKTEPRKLSALVCGDLDWIVMRALEKDRSRRYETAAAFAEDVRRYLKDQPVEARPPSPLYRFRKFTRRHKVTITTATLISAAMILGTGISVWQAARAVAERDEKEQALREAVNARNDATAARRRVEDFTERFKAANLLLASGRAHASAGRWPAANADYSRATELQPDHFLVWSERGSLYQQLGLWRRAAADYDKAIELGASPVGPAWWGVPQLFAYVGDDRRYRAICTQMLQQAEMLDGLSSPEIRACVLTASSVTDAAALAERAEVLLAETPNRPFGPRPFGDGPPPRHDQYRGDSFDRPPRDSSRKNGPPPNRPERSLDDAFDAPPKPPQRKSEPPPVRPERRRDDDFDRPPAFPPGNDRPTLDRTDRFPPDGSGRPFGRGNGAWLPRGASLYVAGLAHYRAGQFDQAVARLRESLTDGWPGRSIPYPVLAMAYHRLGQADDARAALASAEQTINDWTATMLDGSVGTMPVPWFDLVECQVLYREANTLIRGVVPPDDPRLSTIEQRALAALEQ